MKTLYFFLKLFLMAALLSACSEETTESDAYGNFEATEIIVSAESNGRLLWLKADEGGSLSEGTLAALVDTIALHLQKGQLNARIATLDSKLQDVGRQLAVYQERKSNLVREQKRIKALLEDGAATQKQYDDLTGEIEVIGRQMTALQSSLSTQNRGVLAEALPLEKQIESLNEQISRSLIKNPIGGIVLEKYAEPGEVAAFGKPLYKIADMDTLFLRAYVSGAQLSQIALGQTVTVRIDDGKAAYQELSGNISWISEKAEFTPKVIQTKEERVSLVYALKVRVPNQGQLKIGMPGEVRF